MHGQHQRYSGRLAAGVVIAAVQDASQHAMAVAIFANVTVPEEIACRTKKSIIVQCLYHWDSCLFARVINGGRYHEKGVMDMNEIRLFSGEQSGDVSPTISSPRHLPY